MPGSQLGIPPEASFLASDQGDARAFRRVDVHDRREVQVDASFLQLATHAKRKAPSCFGRALAHGFGGGKTGKAVSGKQAGHPASFLVDGDEEGPCGNGAQLVRQALQLSLGDDVAGAFGRHVAVEEDDVAKTALLQQKPDGIVLCQFGAPKATHDHGAYHAVEGGLATGAESPAGE